MSVNSRLKFIQIIGQRKALYRQTISRSYFLFSFNATRTAPETKDRPLLTQQQFNPVNNSNVMQGPALEGCLLYLQPPYYSYFKVK